MVQTCQNDLGFSLCTALFICHVVATSEKWIELKVRVSTDINVLLLNTRDQVQ